MKISGKTELRLENFEKCFAVCDHDCPLGQLYDFSYALHNFVLQRMEEAKKLQDEEKAKSEENKTEVSKPVEE